MKKFQVLLSLAESIELWGKESQCYGVAAPDSVQDGPRQEPHREEGALRGRVVGNLGLSFESLAPNQVSLSLWQAGQGARNHLITIGNAAVFTREPVHL